MHPKVPAFPVGDFQVMGLERITRKVLKSLIGSAQDVHETSSPLLSRCFLFSEPATARMEHRFLTSPPGLLFPLAHTLAATPDFPLAGALIPFRPYRARSPGRFLDSR
jgi:hypothetical protein